MVTPEAGRKRRGGAGGRDGLLNWGRSRERWGKASGSANKRP